MDAIDYYSESIKELDKYVSILYFQKNVCTH